MPQGTRTWDRSAYDSARYENAKAALIHMLGGHCSRCRSCDDLQFDHVDPSSKSFAILEAWNRGYAVLLPELAKCQLLCASCHREKTSAEQSVEHGGGASGRRNCKCIPCKARKAEYMRKWKASRAG